MIMMMMIMLMMMMMIMMLMMLMRRKGTWVLMMIKIRRIVALKMMTTMTITDTDTGGDYSSVNCGGGDDNDSWWQLLWCILQSLHKIYVIFRCTITRSILLEKIYIKISIFSTYIFLREAFFCKLFRNTQIFSVWHCINGFNPFMLKSYDSCFKSN